MELVGHGHPGAICLNDQDWTDENVIGPDLDDVKEFASAIKSYCDHLTLFSCNCAAGDSGHTFILVLAESLGRAGGWEAPITVEDGYFNVGIHENSLSATETWVDEPNSTSWGFIKSLFR